MAITCSKMTQIGLLGAHRKFLIASYLFQCPNLLKHGFFSSNSLHLWIRPLHALWHGIHAQGSLAPRWYFNYQSQLEPSKSREIPNYPNMEQVVDNTPNQPTLDTQEIPSSSHTPLLSSPPINQEPLFLPTKKNPSPNREFLYKIVVQKCEDILALL